MVVVQIDRKIARIDSLETDRRFFWTGLLRLLGPAVRYTGYADNGYFNAPRDVRAKSPENYCNQKKKKKTYNNYAVR